MVKALNKTVAVLAVIAAAMALSFAVALPRAYAAEDDAQTLDATDAGIQVSDDVTRFDVAKLDPDTREYVKGATMQIIEKDAGTVVDQWVSTDATHKNSKQLNVNTHYILREISAPDGYEKAKDTEFYIDQTEGVGVHIVSGDDAELTQSYVVNLYDKKADSESTTTVTKQGKDTTTTVTNKVVAPKTGDETPLWLVAGLVVVAAVAIIALQAAKRRMTK